MYNLQELLKQLNIAHTTQCSRDERNLKDAVSACLFAVFESIGKVGIEVDEAIMNDSERPLYIWTKNKMETIKQRVGQNEAYLCSSLSPNAFNTNSAIFSEPYRYKYEVYLQEGTYGILLNKLKGCIHPNEQECLIKLSDIKEYKKIN